MENCWNKPRDINRKLTTTNLKQIAIWYGKLYKECGDLYEPLFKTEHYLDLRNFTILRYMKPPSYYWTPDTRCAYEDTAACVGVPLAFLGARNETNKTYNSWYVETEDPAEVFKYDVFLAHGMASTEVNEDTGKVEWCKEYGLARLPRKRLWDSSDIRTLRLEAAPKSTVSWGVRRVKSGPNFMLYNNCSRVIKHLILQTWCWHHAHRSSDMILDYVDWDKVTKAVDVMKLTSVLKEQKPKSDEIPLGVRSFLSEL
jgi:hypothetical protein